MADMILTAEEDGEDPDLVRRLVDVEPSDGPVDGEMAHAGKDIVPQRAAEGECRQPVRRLADVQHAPRGVFKASSALSPKPI